MSKINLWAKAFPPVTGGVEFYSRQVASALDRQQMLGGVVTWAEDSQPRPEYDGSVAVTCLPGGSDVRCALSGLRQMFGKTARAEGLILATTWKAAVPAFVSGKNYVVSAHGKEIYASGAVHYLAKMVYARARAIVCVSGVTADRLIAEYALPRHKVHVAWNGLTDERLLLTNPTEKWASFDDEIVFYTICRHEPRKNIPHAIRAFAALKNRAHRPGRKLTFLIAGTGPTIDAERALVSELGLHDSVVHLGRVSDEDLIALHQKAHIFLHPQIAMDAGKDFEGFGLVVADAMAAGSLVVTGRSGGTGELFVDGEQGLYVSGEDVDETVARLVEYLRNPAQLRRIAEQAQLKARTAFQWDNVTRILKGCLSDAAR
ncbi:hypothetical protein BTH42_33445 [Burkholderia sp. SRS-W-2-2016]|uniref:glycosyltransferase family 4 protein n=1 Tax=Burkholderia sp. SRS-W-2-2016 TaxID=1926878 RepID=UPI00094B421A|nr:glycosyltransferase family 4 protein [Burkholderia sp. SRS-W-2-2016]OLL27319.1 hypothetical protein BTH42_33445 [Burkholderia sp. SRS-W-2-2016]